MTVQLTEPAGLPSGSVRSALTDLPTIDAAWEALCRRTDAAPFHRPGWYRPWEAAFAPGKLRVLSITRDGQLVAVLPLLRRLGGLSAAANGHSVAFGSVTADDEAVHALARVAASGRYGSVVLDQYVLPPAHRAIWEQELGRTGTRHRLGVTRRSLWTDLTRSPDDLLARLNGSQRKELRRSARRAAELGQVRFDELNEGEDPLEAFDACLRVEASGWKGREGTAIACLPATRRFYEELVTWAASQGWLRVQRLWFGDRLAAFQLSLQHARVQYLLKCGYEDEFRAAGPGKLLDEHLVVSGAANDGLDACDWLGDEGRQNRIWGTRTQELFHLAVYPATVKGTLRRGLDTAGEQGGGWAREHLPASVRARLRATRARLEGNVTLGPPEREGRP